MTVVDDTREFSWMLANFVEQTAGVQGAVAVSSDGLLMAMSSSLDRSSAEPVAAIISGLTSLGQGAAGALGYEGLERIVVAMRRGCCWWPRSATVRPSGWWPATAVTSGPWAIR